MNAPDALAPAEALGRLQAALEYYALVRRQNATKVLARAGQNLSIQLYKGFAAETEREGEITFSAWLRRWRVGGRRGEAGSTAPGISATAAKRASARMGGYSSILAMVSVDSNRIRLRGVRVGKRGRRITGGRRGLGGVATAGTDTELRRAGDVRLNFRAVATIEELNLRESGRRFLAVSFLHRRWRKLSQGAQAEQGVHRVLEATNPRSRLGVLGRVKLETGGPRGDGSLALSSHVPGVAAVGRRLGLFTRAIEAVTDDMAGFAMKQESDQLVGALRKELRV